MDNLKNIINELITSHTHTEIIDEIRNIITKKSASLPSKKILYNSIYGDYNISRYFLKYCGINTSDFNNKEYRNFFASKIEDFGEHISMKYPDIFEMVYIYVKYIAVFHKFRELDKLMKIKANIIYNIKFINNHTKYGLLTQLPKYFSINYKFTDSILNCYSKDIIDTIKDKLISDNNMLESQINDLISYLHKDNINKDLICHILEIMSYLFPEELENNIYFKSSEYHLDYPIDFLDKIKQYGTKSLMLWKNQQYFDEIFIRIILLNKRNNVSQDNKEYLIDSFKNDGSILEFDETILEKVYTQIGLLCASGNNCKLNITHIPALVDWDIKETEGLEYVYIK